MSYYGEKLVRNCWNINDEIMAMAGYKKLPSHSFSRTGETDNWISNANGFRPDFPRFHLVRVKGEWYLHRDLRRIHGDGEGGVERRGEVINCEIRRLRQMWFDWKRGRKR
jgi:hypothetical protein